MYHPPACDYCRKRKRKCDRAVPRCSLCILKSQECRYAEQTGRASGEKSSGIDLLAMDPVPWSTQSKRFEFPSVYFLDHSMFTHSRIDLPIAKFSLDERVLDTFSMASTISSHYFSWIHLWMPIISKKKWKLITGPLAQPAADTKLLLFAMNVLLWKPPQDRMSRDPRHGDYAILKTSLLDAEHAGVLTLELLQTWIMTTIYEYSQAIYPAAYISIGTCIRYSLALGIDKQRRSDIALGTESAEVQEERRRVWWSVVILDLMISRAPSGLEPSPDDLLPVHDHAWDNDEIDISHNYPVTIPPRTNMGMLARLAQSAYLLGKVYRWRDRPTGDHEFDLAEKAQLDHTIRALLNLTYEEGATRLMPICPQTSLCFSALIILHTQQHIPPNLPVRNIHKQVWNASNEQNNSKTAIDTLRFLRPIATESSASTSLFFRREPWSIEKSSPLLLHWTYLIAVTYMSIKGWMELIQESEEYLARSRHATGADVAAEAEHGLNTMKTKLSLLGTQWIAADVYLRILDARELM